MKKCCYCKQDKHAKHFNKNKSRKDGLNTICRDCSNQRSRKYYKDNCEHHKRAIVARKKKIIKQNQSYVLQILENSGCLDCGNKDIRVLQFDHCRDKKFKDVSVLVRGYKFEILQDEIKKCDVVCANCHIIRTYTRKPTYRNGRR